MSKHKTTKNTTKKKRVTLAKVIVQILVNYFIKSKAHWQ